MGELSRGQNKVREVAALQFRDNVTPTWQKGTTDGTVNIIGTLFTLGAFALIVRGPLCA